MANKIILLAITICVVGCGTIKKNGKKYKKYKYNTNIINRK